MTYLGRYGSTYSSRRIKAFEKFKEWKVLVETQTNKKVKKLKTDNGLEFYSEEFNQFCRKQGIERHKTVRGTL